MNTDGAKGPQFPEELNQKGIKSEGQRSRREAHKRQSNEESQDPPLGFLGHLVRRRSWRSTLTTLTCAVEAS